MIWICSHCGERNFDAAVCARCGASRSASSASGGETPLLCPRCQSVIPSDTDVCPACGAALTAQAGTKAQAAAHAPRRVVRHETGSAESDAPAAGHRIQEASDQRDAEEPADDLRLFPDRADRADEDDTEAELRGMRGADADESEADDWDDGDWDSESEDGEPEKPDLSKRLLPIVLAATVFIVCLMLFILALRWNPNGQNGGVSAEDTPEPTAAQSAQPADSAQPTEQLTPAPTATPSAAPTATPTLTPTPTPKLTPTPTPKITATPIPNDYELEALVLEGAERYYTSSELADRSKYELMILRNGMFAISGKIFLNNQEVIDFFTACSWYTPQYETDADARAHMNDYQKKNLETIIAMEKEKGYR